MQDIFQKINVLKARIEKLIHLQQQLLIENHNMVELNQQLVEKIEDQNLTIHQLDEKLKAAKLAQAITGRDNTDEEKETLKSQIGTYIDQVDACIKLLNR
jgi:hypothetical protein